MAPTRYLMGGLGAVLLVLLAVTSVQGQSRKKPDFKPRQLDLKSYTTEIVPDTEAWVIEFYSGRCGSCQEFSPIYEAVGKKYKNDINFGAVNIDEPSGMDLAKHMKALEDGIPNVKALIRHDDHNVHDDLSSVWQGEDLPTLQDLDGKIGSIIKGLKRAPVRGTHRDAPSVQKVGKALKFWGPEL